MHPITGAGYLAGNRQGCLRGTRKDVLFQLEHWLADERIQPVFWLNGLAGTGKSTIAQTFAETSFADGKLGASFFCSRNFEDRSNIQIIFRTLAFQLAIQYPEFRELLLPILKANPEPGRGSLCSQLENFIIGPLKATRIMTLIVIDALEECQDDQPASTLLSVLSRYVDQIPWVKFFITGRPEPRIRSGFRLKALQPITEVLRLHDVERPSVDADIRLFLKTQLDRIAKTRSDCDFTESWPSSYDIDILCKKSAGLFIYASTIVKIASQQYPPTEGLALITSLPQSTNYEGKSGIDFLYTQALEQAYHDACLGEQERYSHFKLVVGAVVLAFYPLSTRTLSELPQIRDAYIYNTLHPLHSLLLVPDNEVDPICPIHKSFPDFLTDPKRCKDERFFIDPLVHHLRIMFSCLDLMKERLRKNCDLDGFPLLSGVKDMPDCLEYTCRFWTKHLLEVPRYGPHIEQVKAAIDEFFTKHLLFWIEVLSLMKHLDLGIYALYDIDQWYLSVSCMGVLSKHTLMYMQTGDSCKWTSDSERLILSNFESLCDFPINIYRHALPFSPSSSWLHKWYTPESLQEVKVIKGHPDKWGTCTRVVSFRYHPEVLAYWKDIIAVGLGSGDITLLDAITGSSKSVFSEHVESVTSLAFSLDGVLLVSGSFDNTIILWDIQTGGMVKSFLGQGWAHSLAISPDASTIASGSIHDVRLWDVRTGKCCHIIDTAQTPDGVACLAFIPDVPGRFVYASRGFVQQWDINGNKIGPVTPGHHIAFSHGGSHFVLCDEGPPTLRDTVSGTITATLNSPGQGFSRCCFSPSDQFVAGVANATVYVWNITTTPHLVETFIPHGTSIFSLIYSFSLVSMHSDGKIRFRRIDNSPDLTTRDTTSTEFPRARIIYTTLQEGVAISLDSVGIIERCHISTGIPEILLQIPKIRYVGSVRLVDTILTIVHHDHSFSSGWGVSIWDITVGERLQSTSLSGDLSILDPTLDRNLGISKDGATFFVVDPLKLRTWSISTGENTGSIFHYNYTRTSSPLSVDLDGPTLWIRSLGRSRTWGWDLENLKTPPLNSSNIPSRLRLACLQEMGGTWGDAGQSMIIDTASKMEVFRLPGRFADHGKVVWDGRYLFVFYETGEPLILDFVHMALP